MNDESNVQVRVVRPFDVPAERVFDAWLNPESIGRWMFGPAVREEEIVRLTIDAHVGGSFSFAVRRNGQEIDHVGNYLEIDRPRRLVFTSGVRQNLSATSRVQIEIVPLEKGCELTLVHKLHPDWVGYASRTEAAWTKMLATLAIALS